MARGDSRAKRTGGQPLKYISWRKNTWEQFTTVGAVIELRPLRTREERLKYIDRGWDPSDGLEPGFQRQTPFGGFSYFFNRPGVLTATFSLAKRC